MELLISFTIGALLIEFYAWSPKLAKWLLDCAVRRLPDEDQERYSEEWHAHLENLPNSTLRVIDALSCYLCIRKIQVGIWQYESQEAEDEFKKLVNLYGEVRSFIADQRGSGRLRPETEIKERCNELTGSARRLFNEKPHPDSAQIIDGLDRFADVLVMAHERQKHLMSMIFYRVDAHMDRAEALITQILNVAVPSHLPMLKSRHAFRALREKRRLVSELRYVFEHDDPQLSGWLEHLNKITTAVQGVTERIK